MSSSEPRQRKNDTTMSLSIWVIDEHGKMRRNSCFSSSDKGGVRLVACPEIDGLCVFSPCSSVNECDDQLVSCTQAYLRGCAGGRPLKCCTAAWQRFYALYAPYVRCIVAGYHIQPCDCEDCVQQIWLTLIAKLPDFRYEPAKGTLSSWLAGVVHRQTLAFLRNEQRRRLRCPCMQDLADARPDAGLEPPESLQSQEDRKNVRNVLSALESRISRDSYRILLLHLIDGMPIKEVAAQLKLTPGQVRCRCYRLKKKLRRTLCSVHGKN